jgi:hypothetical protein
MNRSWVLDAPWTLPPDATSWIQVAALAIIIINNRKTKNLKKLKQGAGDCEGARAFVHFLILLWNLPPPLLFSLFLLLPFFPFSSFLSF